MKTLNASTKLCISQALDLSLEDLIGKCVAVLGMRGSGKSNTSGVIFEELLKFNHPLAIVDIDSEYWGLKEKFEILVVGAGDNVDIEVDVDSAEQIAEISLQQSVPVILDMSGYLAEDRDLFLKYYFERLWNLAGNLRRPYMVMLEEAHEFIPQGVRTDLKEIISRIALRGRKRGLGAVITSQRSAKVEKDVLTQAGILFLHRVVHDVDLAVYRELIPWKPGEVKETVSHLDVGECIFLSEDQAKKVYIRERQTFHAGFTPSLEPVAIPTLKQVSQEILDAISQAKESHQKKSRLERMQERIDELEAKLSERDKKINDLEEVARTLGYIRVEVAPPLLPKVQHIAKAVIQSLQGIGVLKEEDAPRASEAVQEAVGKMEGQVSQEETPLAYDSLPEPVKRHVQRILDRVRHLKPLEQKILAFLVDRAPSEYSTDQLAAWLDYSESTLVNNPPKTLLQMGIIARVRKMGGEHRTLNLGYHYQATLGRFVKQEFEPYLTDIGETELRIIQGFLQRELVKLGEAAKER